MRYNIYIVSRGDLMAETKGNSQTRAKNKYNSKNYDSLRIVVAKGQKEVLQSIAKEQGASLNGYTKQALQAKIKADTGKDVEL